MPLLETLTLTLGPAIAKSILKIWLKDSDIGLNVTSSFVELIVSKTKDVRAQQKGKRQFEEIGEKVAEDLRQVFEVEGAGLQDNGLVAVAMAVAATLDKAPIDAALLAEQNLESTRLAEYLLTRPPSEIVGLSCAETELYRRIIQESCKDIIDIASQLPAFTEHTFSEVLRRQNQLIDIATQILGEVQLRSDAERLSIDLFRTVAQLSLDRHEQTFAIGHLDSSYEITRAAHFNVNRFFEASSKRLLGLRGPSGTGKSTLLRQIGRVINDRAGLAIWIPAEELVVGTSVATLLLNVLQQFYPTLNARAGDDALKLGAKLPGGLTLLVDDINRIDKSTQALTAITSWNAPTRASSGSSEGGDGTIIRWVVPLWPGQFAASPNMQSASRQWEFIELGNFSSVEQVAFAHAVAHSDEKHVQRVVEALHGDPFLCGLAVLESVVLEGHKRTELLRNIFDGAIERAATAAQQTLDDRVPLSDFDRALNALVGFMLLAADPEPTWVAIRQALSNDVCSLLLRHAESHQLGWIGARDSHETWRWKHTRLRDLLIGRWIAANVLEPALDNDVTPQMLKWLSDPGLAEAVALAIIYLPSNKYAKALTLLSRYQPLALAEVLYLNLFPVETDLRTLIASMLQQLLADYIEPSDEFVEPPQTWLLSKLADTSDPLVLTITQNLNGKHRWWAARLRNGDLATGLAWVQHELRHRFLPHTNYPYLEQRLAAFSHIHNNRRGDVVNALAAAIAKPEQTGAALIFASYLRWPECVQPMWEVWAALPEEQQLTSLANTVWFLSCCADTNVRPKLEAAFLLSLKVNDEGRLEGKGSERYWHFLEPLRLSLWRPIQPIAAEAWASIVEGQSELQDFVAPLLGGIDHPAPLETYIRWKGVRKAWSFWDEGGESIDPLADPPFRRRPVVNADSRTHLWALARTDVDQQVRLTAFHFWKRAATGDDLPALHTIAVDDPLFEHALKVRLKLHDSSAASFLIERMYIDPASWCGYAPLLANEPGVLDALLDQLDAALSGDNEYIGHSNWVFQHLPTEQLLQVVRKKRDCLLMSPGAWPSLWRSDEPEALQLFQAAVAQADGQHLEFLFFRGATPHYVSLRMLDALKPILSRFSSMERQHIADLALHNGFREWVQEYLPDVLVSDGKLQYRWVTDVDIIAELDAAAALVPQGLNAVYRNTRLFSLVLTLRERSASVANIMQVLRTWLQPSSGSNECTVVALLTARFGAGDDIEWWQAQEGTMTQALAREVWTRTLFVLQRRKWHAAGTIVEG
ncbi:MAG: ATP-binding protein [Herpetosiphonaceae bacterium]|nr:ATP-binding protein [Herpetosiphonaceae bacterium]